jgi:hypothetical protein
MERITLYSMANKNYYILLYTTRLWVVHRRTVSWVSKPFSDKGPRPLLWAGSPAARGKITISGISSRLNYCVIFKICTQLTNMAASRIIITWRAADWRPADYIVFFKLLALCDCLTYLHVEFHCEILIFFFRFKDYKSILPLFIEVTCISFSSSCTEDVCPFHISPDRVWDPFSFPAKWHRGRFPPGVNRLRRDVDFSPLSSAEVKIKWRYNSTPSYKSS